MQTEATTRFEHIAIDRILPNPRNPRIFREGDPRFAELVASIQTHGVIEPCIARPLLDGKCELIAGERRWRASKAAGRETLPVLLRELDDDAAFALLMTENLQREDLHPLEEANAIAAMREQGWTVDQIEAQLGKPRRYVIRRGKLADLIPAWRDMVTDAEHPLSAWGAAHLEMIARFEPHIQEDLARKATRFASSTLHWARMTPKDLNEYLGERLMALSGALWRTTDEDLIAEAGSCSGCPKRSDKQPELFDDVDETDYRDAGRTKKSPGARCLDKDCWNRKLEAHLLAKEAELRQKHGVVLLIGGYNNVKGTPWEGKVVEPYSVLECKKSDPGAIPVLDVAGYSVGKVGWCKLERRAKAVDRNGNTVAVEVSLANRKAKWEKKRQRLVLEEVLEMLNGMAMGDRDIPERLTYRERLALVSLSGTDFSLTGYGLYSGTTSSFWKTFESRVDRPEADNIDLLCRSAIKVLAKFVREHLSMNLVSEETPLMDWIEDLCSRFGLDYAGIYQQAVDATPYPKSWAKLEEAEAQAKPAAKPKHQRGGKAAQAEAGR